MVPDATAVVQDESLKNAPCGEDELTTNVVGPATLFGLPRMMRVAGSSSPFGTIHQQKHARQRKKSTLRDQRTSLRSTTSDPLHSGHCVRAESMALDILESDSVDPMGRLFQDPHACLSSFFSVLPGECQVSWRDREFLRREVIVAAGSFP